VEPLLTAVLAAVHLIFLHKMCLGLERLIKALAVVQVHRLLRQVVAVVRAEREAPLDKVA
jgi:hypothetical protein